MRHPDPRARRHRHPAGRAHRRRLRPHIQAHRAALRRQRVRRDAAAAGPRVRRHRGGRRSGLAQRPRDRRRGVAGRTVVGAGRRHRNGGGARVPGRPQAVHHWLRGRGQHAVQRLRGAGRPAAGRPGCGDVRRQAGAGAGRLLAGGLRADAAVQPVGRGRGGGHVQCALGAGDQGVG